MTKERPILFNDEMVRALLDGRKTQTRRVVKGVPLCWLEDGFTPEFVADSQNHLCPFGTVGDRLWVREAWQVVGEDSLAWATGPEDCHYRADDNGMDGPLVWRPSIYMSRWASRLTLEITGVRVERVQDISETDVRCEGIVAPPQFSGISPDGPVENESAYEWCPWSGFADLWDNIHANKPGQSWADNPWVWCISFRRVTP